MMLPPVSPIGTSGKGTGTSLSGGNQPADIKASAAPTAPSGFAMMSKPLPGVGLGPALSRMKRPKGLT